MTERFGPQCAFTRCVKIVSQLLNTNLSTGTKSVTPLDNGAEFQGALTAATAAAVGASTNGATQIKSKLQTPTSKSETSETKKKSAAPESVNADVPALEIATLQQVPTSTVNLSATSLPLTTGMPTPSFGQMSTGLNASAEIIGGGASSSSSLAPISPFVQVPTNILTTEPTDQKAVDGKLIANKSSEKSPRVSALDVKEQLGSDSISSHPELETPRVDAVQEQGNGSSVTPTVPIVPMVATVPMAATKLSRAESTLQTAVDRPPTTDASLKNIPELRALAGGEAPISSAITSESELETAQIVTSQGRGEISSTTSTTAPVAPAVQHAATALTRPAFVTNAKAAPTLPVEVPTVAPTSPVSASSIISAVPVLPSGVASQSVPVSQTVTTSQPVIPKVATADQVSKVSKSADTSISSTSVASSTSPSLSTQQTSTAVTQSITSMPLPSISFAGEFQSMPAVAASQTQVVGNGTSSIKGDASRQTTTSAKAKPASDTSGPGSRFADGSGNSTQTDSASPAAVSSVAKVSEAPMSGNQGANESRNVVDIANFQQAPPASPTSGVNHTPQASQSVNASAGTTAQNLPPQATPDSQPMQGVNSAQLIQSMRSSEMKLGMQSAEFGNISISTSLNHQTLSAQISLDHSELGRALAVHLPAIEEKIGSAYGVQAKVELRDNNNPSSSSDSGYSNSGQQSREQRQSQGGGSSVSQIAAFEAIAPRASFTPVSMTASASRLDIRV